MHYDQLLSDFAFLYIINFDVVSQEKGLVGDGGPFMVSLVVCFDSLGLVTLEVHLVKSILVLFPIN